MGLVELLLIAGGLAMDAFAVAVSKGMSMRCLRLKSAGVIALFFGVFQAVMPLLGWLLGRQFQGPISSVDHWVAFFLLLIIGGKMIWESRGKDDCDGKEATSLHLKELLILAVATSIDALAVGITFAFLQVSILPAASLIGAITLALSFIGVCLGHRFSLVLKSRAEIIGGVILILIGTKILLSHLGILP